MIVVLDKFTCMQKNSNKAHTMANQAHVVSRLIFVTSVRVACTSAGRIESLRWAARLWISLTTGDCFQSVLLWIVWKKSWLGKRANVTGGVGHWWGQQIGGSTCRCGSGWGSRAGGWDGSKGGRFRLLILPRNECTQRFRQYSHKRLLLIHVVAMARSIGAGTQIENFF